MFYRFNIFLLVLFLVISVSHGEDGVSALKVFGDKPQLSNRLPQEKAKALWVDFVPGRPVSLKMGDHELTIDSNGKTKSFVNHSTGKEDAVLTGARECFSGVVKISDDQESHIAFKELQREGEYLLIKSGNIGLIFRIEEKLGRLLLHLVHIQERGKERLLRLSFILKSQSQVAIIPLNWMSAKRHHGVECIAIWDWIYAHQTSNPLGSVALFTYRNDKDHDKHLLNIWVEDGLPHPRLQNWDINTACEWLAIWQSRFRDQSTMVIQAGSPEELQSMTSKALDLGMKKIYLHTDTWRGEYWPMKNSFLHVNRNTFPRGDEDLKKYALSLKRQGVDLALHTVSGVLAYGDKEAHQPFPHPQVATWLRGKLQNPLDKKSKEIIVELPKDFQMPGEITHAWQGPNHRRSWMDNKAYLVGNELIVARQAELLPQGQFKLTQLQRGVYDTAVESHEIGESVIGYLRPYGRSFMAHPDSDLFRSTVKRFTKFVADNHITHLECDGMENHLSVAWGRAKFSWLLYENIPHPVTSNTSSGAPLPFHIEYWFKSSSSVLSSAPRGGVAGGDGIPLILDKESRSATGAYEWNIKPFEALLRKGKSLNVIRPIPMFGVGEHLWENHGLTKVLPDFIEGWRYWMKHADDDLLAKLKKYAGRYNSPLRQASNQGAVKSIIRPVRLNEGGDQWGLQSLHPLSLHSNPLFWGWGQEYGPLVSWNTMRSHSDYVFNHTSPQSSAEWLIRIRHRLGEKQGRGSQGATQVKDPVSPASAMVEQYRKAAGEDIVEHPLRHSQRMAGPATAEHGDLDNKTYYRASFDISQWNETSTALLNLHVNHWTNIYINGKKAFGGARGHFTLVADVSRHLVVGKNQLAIECNHPANDHKFSMSLHIQSGAEEFQFSSDASWRSSRKFQSRWEQVDFDDSRWQRAAVHGPADATWGMATLKAVEGDRSLLPQNESNIRQFPHHKVKLENEALSFWSKNSQDSERFFADERPSWVKRVDLYRSKGLAFDLYSEGTGGLFVVTLHSHGARDYVVELNQKGWQSIVIPHGEVAWSHPQWGWRRKTSHMEYSMTNRVEMGFGRIPAKTTSRVMIKNLRLLQESDVHEGKLTLHWNDKKVLLPGPFSSDQTIWYRGNGQVQLLDLNWNVLREFKVDSNIFELGDKPLKLKVTTDSKQSFWMDTQIFAVEDVVSQ